MGKTSVSQAAATTNNDDECDDDAQGCHLTTEPLYLLSGNVLQFRRRPKQQPEFRNPEIGKKNSQVHCEITSQTVLRLADTFYLFIFLLYALACSAGRHLGWASW